MDIAPHERPGNEAPKSRIGKYAELKKFIIKKNSTNLKYIINNISMM